MLNGVHSHTTNLRPAVTLDPVLVVCATSLKHRLLSTTATGNLANGGAALAADNLLAARGELDAGDASIGVVSHNDSIVTRAPCHGSSVTCLLLNVADDRTFGHLADGLDVTDGQVGVLTAVDVLSGVDTLGGDEELLVLLVADGVSELHLGEGGATTRVVDDFSHHAADVTMTLSGIKSAELGGTLPMSVVGFEDGPTTLTL